MMMQGVPPAPPSPPPIGPQFDPNLIFLNDGGPPIILLIVIAALTATVIILWPIMRAFGRRLEGRSSIVQAKGRSASGPVFGSSLPEPINERDWAPLDSNGSGRSGRVVGRRSSRPAA